MGMSANHGSRRAALHGSGLAGPGLRRRRYRRLLTAALRTDLRPASDAICTGLHREALNRRYDWFERTGHPNYVFW